VWSGDRVDGIEITWLNSKNGTVSSRMIGSQNGTKNDPWPPDPGEPITAINGNLGVHNSLRLFSIQFSTPTGVSPTYGSQKNDANVDSVSQPNPAVGHL
jgi:hypothetical protein